MQHFNMSGVLHFEGLEESSGSICVGQTGVPPTEEPIFVVLASLTGALVETGVKAGLVG